MERLAVSGVTIAYRTLGQGVFLFLAGAPAGITDFSDLAARLSKSFTVVVHDPRGIGASSLESDARIDASAFADDLSALIHHFNAAPAIVFGASGGAVTGLEMFVRHPDDVKLLIAHEPPLFRLLGNNKAFELSEQAFRLGESNPSEGIKAFMSVTRIMECSDAEPSNAAPPPTPEEEERNRFFVTRMAPATVRYQPQFDMLQERSILAAAGEASEGQPAHQAAAALAHALRIPLQLAPGNHTAPTTEPDLFADWLTNVLANALH